MAVGCSVGLLLDSASHTMGSWFDSDSVLSVVVCLLSW